MTRKLPIILFLLLLLIFVSDANAQTTTTGSAQNTASSASKLREQMQLIQDQKKAAVATVKEAKDELKAQIQAKRDEFKTRVQNIKDQKKKALIERIDTKLAEANKSQTSKYSEAITKLQGILEKTRQSTTDAKVLTSVATAQTAIDTAKAAIDIQAGKTYTMNIVDDATLKLNAGTTVSQLRQDLTTVHKLVIDAKQTIQKLNVEKELIKNEATSSVE